MKSRRCCLFLYMAGILIFIVGFIVGYIVGYIIGSQVADKPLEIISETRETYIDTIQYRSPKPESELVLGTRRYSLPTYRLTGGAPHHRSDGDTCAEQRDSMIVAACGAGAGGEPGCSNDSAIVELPIIQRHYVDSTYEAWVSGPIDPRLDSVRVSAPTTLITRREWKPPKRWHIGITAGYGYGAKGFQPYIGVGITYSIISF